MGSFRRQSYLFCKDILRNALIHNRMGEVPQNSRISPQSFVWRDNRVKSVLINVTVICEKHGKWQLADDCTCCLFCGMECLLCDDTWLWGVSVLELSTGVLTAKCIFMDNGLCREILFPMINCTQSSVNENPLEVWIRTVLLSRGIHVFMFRIVD